MISIAVCDDDIRLCTFIEQTLFDMARSMSEKLYVELYFSGEGLYRDLCNKKCFDILFLDIELVTMTGIAIGKTIREELDIHDIQIIYISAHKEYALHLFEVRPLNFLIKPIKAEDIERNIKKAMSLIGVKPITFQYKLGREYYRVYIKDILYFKGKDREVEIVMRSGSDRFYSTLGGIYEKLREYRFFFAHKSYLVNFDYIEQFKYDHLLMHDGTVVKIGQTRRKYVRDLYMEYTL